MIYKMYCVHDVKTGVFFPPMYCHNAAHAMRSCMSVFKDPNSNIAMYPADFKLFGIGEFDDMTSKIVSLPVPEFICDFNALLPKPIYESEVKNVDTKTL